MSLPSIDLFREGYGCHLCSGGGNIWFINGSTFNPTEPYNTARSCPVSCFWDCFFFAGTTCAYGNIKGGTLDVSDLWVGHEAFVNMWCVVNSGTDKWCGCYCARYDLPGGGSFLAQDWTCVGVTGGYVYGFFYYIGIDSDEICANGCVCFTTCFCGDNTPVNSNDLCFACGFTVCCLDPTRFGALPGGRIWVSGQNLFYTDNRICSTAGLECGYCHCIKNDSCNHTDWSEQCEGISIWRFQGNLIDSVGSNNGSAVYNGYCDDGVDDCSILLNNCSNYVNVGSDVSLDDMWSGGATISVWFCRTGGGRGMLVSKGEWELRANGGVIRFLHRTDGICAGIWNSAECSFTCGVWNNVVITYDSDSNANSPCIYVNGVNKPFSTYQQPSGTLCDDSGAIMYLGNAGTCCDNYLGGKLSQTWLFSEIIDSNGITNLYNNCIPIVKCEGNIWLDTRADNTLDYIDSSGIHRRTHQGRIFSYITWLGNEDFLGCDRGTANAGAIWSDSFYNYSLVLIDCDGIQFQLSNGATFNNCEQCVIP